MKKENNIVITFMYAVLIILIVVSGFVILGMIVNKGETCEDKYDYKFSIGLTQIDNNTFVSVNCYNNDLNLTDCKCVGYELIQGVK